MQERYSMEVNDDCVKIYGTLTIEETFDFLNFFEKKGFNSIGIGYQNSSLMMYKESTENDPECPKENIIHHEADFFRNLYADKVRENEQLIERIEEIGREKDTLSLQVEKLERIQNNPELKKVMSKYEMGCVPSGTQVETPPNWMPGRCC